MPAAPVGIEEDPRGCVNPDIELPATGPTVLDTGGRTPLEIDGIAELPTAPEVAVTSTVREVVSVTGQTVVETGTIMVETGQLLIPGPQLQIVTSLVVKMVEVLSAGK